jgi:hypothetical protein
MNNVVDTVATMLLLGAIFVGLFWGLRTMGRMQASVQMAIDQVTIRYYQALGFFAGQDVDTLAATIAREHGEEKVVHRQPARDALVLGYDRNRVYQQRPELTLNYARLLEDWSAITAGEHWLRTEQETTHAETIELRFRLDDEAYEIAIARSAEPLELLSIINQLLPAEGRHFFVHRSTPALIVFVTTDEAALVWDERHLSLAGV